MGIEWVSCLPNTLVALFARRQMLWWAQYHYQFRSVASSFVYMSCVHVLCTCLVYMSCVHVLCTCLVYMSCVHVLCTCLVYMFCAHTQSSNPIWNGLAFYTILSFQFCFSICFCLWEAIQVSILYNDIEKVIHCYNPLI